MKKKKLKIKLSNKIYSKAKKLFPQEAKRLVKE